MDAEDPFLEKYHFNRPVAYACTNFLCLSNQSNQFVTVCICGHFDHVVILFCYNLGS